MKKKWLAFLGAALLTVQLAAAGLPVSAEGDELVLSNCDTNENWSANVNGDDALVSDSENKTEGAASVGAHAVKGKLNQIQFLLDEPIDISGYKYLEFDVYYSDLTWFNDCGGVMFEITSSGKCDMESSRWQKGVLRTQLEQNFIDGKDNWWHIKLSLAEPQSQANGGCKLSNFNYFRFYSVDPISTTPDYDIRIDNLKVTNNEDPVEPEDPSEPENPSSGDDTSVPGTPADGSSASESKPDEENQGDDSSVAGSSKTPESGNASTPDDTAGGLGIGAIVGIVVAAIVVLGGGGFAVYWFVIRKKK